jgi:hypothetical protein
MIAAADVTTWNKTFTRVLPDPAFECVTRSEKPIKDDTPEIRAIGSAAYGP